ncbi:MAG: hypothetical protein WBA42_22485 [Mesorhizobium sp.]
MSTASRTAKLASSGLPETCFFQVKNTSTGVNGDTAFAPLIGVTPHQTPPYHLWQRYGEAEQRQPFSQSRLYLADNPGK